MSRLKSLELHGYKTFASKTLFEFPAEITAIVGPNGSGKSNISDSIRWVLGEQSFGLLRGRKTEDMIFSGSEQRAKAGMAEATITFNNENGWLPIDFTEVSISRRAYRDGQNEYLLNGQKVRLKEIYELLAQSGLGQRTYTIIGQGLVDAALSLKPEERRRFFEEAAGIGLYRSRREDALTRLDATRRNLERVKDILSELEPRLESLEKQARRALEYERIKADLQLLLRDWYGFHWHRSQSELTHAHEVAKVQEARLDQARDHANEADEKTEELRKKLQETRTQLNQWHARSAEVHTRWEKISRSLAVLDERRRALVEQQQDLQNNLVKNDQEHQTRLERMKTLQEEVERLEKELTEARTQAATARRDLQNRQNEREKTEYEMRETRRQMVNLETKRVQRSAHQTELISRVDNINRSKASLQATIEKENKTFQEAQKILEEIGQKREALEATRKQSEETVQATHQAVSKIENILRKLQEDRTRLETEKSRLSAQLSVLEQAEKSFSGLNQGARFLLESARQGKLAGKYQSLSNMIEVPSEYETAIAAVLGEHLDGVLLFDQTDPENALQILSGSEKGRAVLLPVGSIQKSDILSAPQDSSCLGNAADLIKTSEELKPIVYLLLGQVLLVPDRTAARQLIGKIPSTARLVTLKGEVFWGSGVVVAGQDGRAGMIARPRQKKELQASIDQYTQQLTSINQQMKDAQMELDKQRALEQELQKSQRNLSQEISQVSQALQKASLGMEQARQRVEFNRNQLNGIDSQIKKTNDEIKLVEKEIEETGIKINEYQEQVRKLNRALGGLPLDELQAQVSHWTTNTAVVERAVKDARSRQEEHRTSLEENEHQKQALLQRQENTQSQLKQLEDEKRVGYKEENLLAEEIDTLQQQIDPTEKALTLLEKQFSDLQATQTAARQALSVAERYSSQAQLDVTRQREALDSLRRRIEEDFGLVAFEYKADVLSPTPLPLEGMVEQLPKIKEIQPSLEENINRFRSQLRRMGAVNLDAHNEYKSVKERYDFLKTQVEDLKRADEDLRKVIEELDELMKREFLKTFHAVAAQFKQLFTRLFGGGSARLILEDEENPTEGGVEIEARLPGRREQGLSLLSGGERSLTAVALIFSLLKVSPTPFCILDEVDAALDEANVGRFCDMLRELSASTQFIIITHNRNTVQASDVIYGITMGRDSTSQVISLKLDEVSEDMVH